MYRGVIEGFFGKSWSHSARLNHIQQAKTRGESFYIYAPKNDALLRKHWQSSFSVTAHQQLHQLGIHCHQHQLQFGIGLSPFEAHLNFNADCRRQLKTKIAELNTLKPDILCLLFDDMRGDKANLAQVQVEMTQLALDHSSADKVIICPSYYTEDPVLDKVFGQRPSNYLEDLGRLMHPDVDIFWTGPKVCSPNYPDPAIKIITEQLQRKPFLWDNYPVNDGAKLCKHLHLKGFSKRTNLNPDKIAGHAINPMNQAWLSQIPLSTLPELYHHGDTTKVTHCAILALCEQALAQALLEDLELFQHGGLDKMDTKAVITKYQQLPPSPHRDEIIDWLSGNYTFDPSCLTD